VAVYDSVGFDLEAMSGLQSVLVHAG